MVVVAESMLVRERREPEEVSVPEELWQEALAETLTRIAERRERERLEDGKRASYSYD
jgi:hypothetical protein